MKLTISIVFGLSLLFSSQVSSAQEKLFPYDPSASDRGSKLFLSSARYQLEMACQEETEGIKKQIKRGYLPHDFVCDPIKMETKVREDAIDTCKIGSFCSKDPDSYVAFNLTLMTILLRLEMLD